MMEWFNACTNPWLVTSRYENVPALSPFPIYDCQFDGSTSLNVRGYLPRLPDKPDLSEGQVPECADLFLAFQDVKNLSLFGIPDRDGGEMRIERLRDSEVYFEYESPVFRFSGVCNRATVCWVGVLAKHDPTRVAPRGSRLFGHPNVWNTCLLMLREFGYTLRVSGHPALRDFTSRMRWHATMPDGTDLSADTPIELLGLASIHRYHKPNVDSNYWWQLDGPSLVTELIDEWEKRSIPG